MTLKSLHLINFERHQDTLIEFVPGINIIYGSTDQGKSSIRRALTWVALNRPIGPRSVRDDTDESSVTVCFENAPSVTRGRKKDKNYYKIDATKVDGSGVNLFKAFSTKVPEEVTQILDITEVNIQEQFKEYYLLQDTAGQVAKTIHILLGMDLIDKTATVVNKAITYQKTKVATRTAHIESIKTEIKKYSHVEASEEEFKDLELAIHDYEKQITDIHNLTVLLDKCRILHQKILAATIPPDVEEEARLLQKELQEIEPQKNTADRLEQALSFVLAAEGKIKHINEWLAVEPEALALREEIVSLSTQEAKLKPLERAIEHIDRIDHLIKSKQREIDSDEKALEALKKELKICPVCKKPF